MCLLQGLETRDVTRQRTRRDSVRAAEPNAGPERPGKFRLMELMVTWSSLRRLPGATIRTSPAPRRHHFAAYRLERFNVPLRPAIVPDPQSSELEKQAGTLGDTHASIEAPLQHLVIEIEILAFSGGARSS